MKQLNFIRLKYYYWNDTFMSNIESTFVYKKPLAQIRFTKQDFVEILATRYRIRIKIGLFPSKQRRASSFTPERSAEENFTHWRKEIIPMSEISVTQRLLSEVVPISATPARNTRIYKLNSITIKISKVWASQTKRASS